MKKNTLIRSERAHTVKMQEGTNVAQRKAVKKDSLAPPPDVPPPINLQKLPPVEPVAYAKPKAKPSVSKTRKKTTLAAPVDPQPGRPAKPAPKAKVAPTGKALAPKLTKAKVAAPEPAASKTSKAKTVRPQPPPPLTNVWEADNPIQQRLARLRMRNAELEEQIQRLQQSMPARGKRP